MMLQVANLPLVDCNKSFLPLCSLLSLLSTEGPLAFVVLIVFDLELRPNFLDLGIQLVDHLPAAGTHRFCNMHINMCRQQQIPQMSCPA